MIGAVSATGEMGDGEVWAAVAFGVASGVSGPVAVLGLVSEVPRSFLVGKDWSRP